VEDAKAPRAAQRAPPMRATTPAQCVSHTVVCAARAARVDAHKAVDVCPAQPTDMSLPAPARCAAFISTPRAIPAAVIGPSDTQANADRPPAWFRQDDAASLASVHKA